MCLSGSKQVKIPVVGNVPRYATKYSVGADLFAHMPDSITLLPGERALIPTNTYLAIPNNYEGQVRPRSGLAIQHGITLLNSPGTIDTDYRGEIKVPLINLGQEPYTIVKGDRVAQLIIAPCMRVEFIQLELNKLPKTNRGDGGFGSTGR